MLIPVLVSAVSPEAADAEVAAGAAGATGTDTVAALDWGPVGGLASICWVTGNACNSCHGYNWDSL